MITMITTTCKTKTALEVIGRQFKDTSINITNLLGIFRVATIVALQMMR